MIHKIQVLQLALFLALLTFPRSTFGEPVRGKARRLQTNLNAKQDVFASGAPEAVADEELTGRSILDIVTSNQNLGTLVTALSVSGLSEMLGGEGPFTIFAPTDDAFVDADIEFLLDPEWILHLEAVLLYHVVEESLTSADLLVGDIITSVFENEPINVTGLNPLSVNDADVLQPDIIATNGVVHVVDHVLFPEFTQVTISELAARVPDQLSTFAELLEAANLTETLGDDDEVYTVFAPNNDAFAKLNAATLEHLRSPEGAATLEDILMYHVVPGIAYASGVDVGDAAETLYGVNITVTSIDPDLVVNSYSKVISADILTRNGVIHIIDTVLMPPSEDDDDSANSTMTEENFPNEAPPVGQLDLDSWAFQGENFTTLFSFLNATGLTEGLSGPGPLTLFAPNNAAFSALPNSEKYWEPEWYAHLYDILLYHVVPGIWRTSNLTKSFNLLTALGENITVTSADPWIINNVSTVGLPDNVVSNGIAHGINAVLLPPSAVYSIIDVIEGSPFFAQLLGLITAATMEELLGGPGPFTVFAPTNNAIKLMDAETSALFQSPEGLDRLQKTLRYHVVPGIILSDDVTPEQMFQTLQGCMLTLSQFGKTFYINDAAIVDADILGSNGVIHVIDSVLLPSDDCEILAPVDPGASPSTGPVEPILPTVENATTAPFPEPEHQNETSSPEPFVPEENLVESKTNSSMAPVEGITDTLPDIMRATSSSVTVGVVSAVTISSLVPFLLLV